MTAWGRSREKRKAPRSPKPQDGRISKKKTSCGAEYNHLVREREKTEQKLDSDRIDIAGAGGD